MLNNCTFVGRLTKDPETQYTNSGVAFCEFTIAVNRVPQKKSEFNDEPDYVPCIIWNKQAENLSKYTKKGNLVGLRGEFRSKKYFDSESKVKYETKIYVETLSYLEPIKR